MDLLDRLLGHDAWTTRQLLLISSELTDEELDHGFDIGRGTLRETFAHVVRNVEAWADLMACRPIREDGGRSIPDLRGGWDERWVDYRAQLIHMLRGSGVEDVPEGDVLGWEGQFYA